MSQRLALLIGMTAYQDDRLEAPATGADVRTLVDLLRDPENGRFDRVVPLFNQTAVDLQLGIAGFLEQPIQPDDVVLFYFTGHALIHHQNIYLAATDTFTEAYLDATTVEIDFIRRRLQACPARQVILLDTTFSLMGATDRHTAGTAMLAQAFAAENRAVLAGESITDALIAGLHGAADADQDGTITFVELSAYAADQMPEETAVVSEASPEMGSVLLVPGEMTAVPLAPYPALPPASPGSALSQRQRMGIGALVLLLLLTAFGLYALSSGLFTGNGAAGRAAPTDTATATTSTPEGAAAGLEDPTQTAMTGAATAATGTPLPTATPPATLTAVASETTTAPPTGSATPTHTATPPPPSATPTVTNTPTPSATDTPTRTPSPQPTSEPVPMTVVAQQAFLRAGPGINYRIIAFPGQGTAVTIIARNGDGAWFNAILADGTRGWLYQDVIVPEDDTDFNDISVAATIPVPEDDFYDPVLTPSGSSLSLQVYHTYVGTQGENAYFQARLLPETDLVQPTYLNGQELGLGLLIVEFNRVAEGAYTSEQIELCMVSETGQTFYCETIPARKTW